MSERDSVPPAMGERRAIGGYHPQYRVAAGLILRALREGTLEWIRVADPEAGRVDDLQIATRDRLDAYQIKWSRFPQSITFNDIVRAGADRPSLISQLADGWRRLKFQHQRRIVVHLLTDDFPSTNDHVPGASQPQSADHFAAFLTGAWQPRSQDTSYSPPKRWSQAWAALTGASGLQPGEFDALVAACRLDLGYRLPDDIDDADSHNLQREASAWKSDLDQLQLALFGIVADKRQIVQLTRNELLDWLGWRERLEFRSRHDFPPTSIPYEEITGTAEELFRALQTQAGGYLILLGTPGSGKSTLLSHALRYRQERVVRYYSYIPETLEPSSTRGEAVNFLHDVVLAFEQLGFRPGKALIRNDLTLLAARFIEQLQRLHQDYVETGRKTALVVDGLDHIAREQSPNRSLLRELPLPQHVPEGVFIILGSQTDHLPELPSAVRAAIEDPTRRIQMRLLLPAAVQSIVNRAGFDPAPTGEQIERLLELSGGHPLALGYIINRLRMRSTPDIDDVLSQIEPYVNHIDAQYVTHWHQVEGDRKLVHLLALLARVRGAIDIRWVEEWANNDALYELHRRFKHYFRIEVDARWYFFHNSFRAFLTERTRRLPGVASGDEELFAELATHSAATPATSPQHWDELYYRAAAQHHAEVDRLTDPRQIRAQFLAGRSIQSIRADIRRAYASAGATRDLVLLARLCLLASEYNLRENNLEQILVTDMLLALGEDRIAINRLREGQQLRVPTIEALKASAALLGAGLDDEAQRIFTLAEPLDVLSSPTPISSHEHDETVRILTAWIEGAIHFRPVGQIIAAIDRLQVDETVAHRNETTASLHDSLCFEVFRSLLAAGRWDDAGAVSSRWATEQDSAYWFWAHVHVWREASHFGETSRALAAIEAAQEWTKSHDLDPNKRVILAEAVLRVRGDTAAAAALIAGVQQPPLADSLRAPLDSGFQPFRLRFQLNRLLAALGQERPLRDCVPDADQSREEGLVLFERQVCVVARLFGRSWAGRLAPPQIFVNESLGVLRLFNRPYPHEWTTWYLAQAGRTELYQLLVRAASLHGSEVLDALTEAFEREWDDVDSRGYWPSDIIRDVVVAFAEAGASATWAHRRLTLLDEDLFHDDEIQSRLKSAQAQFNAYVSVGDLDSARRAYNSLLAASLGVGYKDYQVTGLLGWAELANRDDPVAGAARIEAVASFMPPLEGTHVEWDALEEAVQIACRWHLSAGLRVIEWLFDNARLQYAVGLRVLLAESLNRASSPVAIVSAVYRWLSLPFDLKPDPDFLRSLASRLVGMNGPDEVEVTFTLSKDVRTYALPSVRAALLKALTPPPNEAAGTHAEPDADESTSSMPITYEIDGERLTEFQVAERAVSVEAITRLLATSRESFFRWEHALESFVLQATREDVLRLADAFSEVKRSSMTYALLARRLYELGHRNEAVSTATRGFRLTEPSGWHNYYDGATRLRVLETLAAMDRNEAQRIGFELLINELTSGTADGGPLAVELIRILPVLSDQVPAVRIWLEVSWYLEGLFAHAGQLKRPDLADIAPGDENNESAVSVPLCRWIMTHFDHPTNALARSAQRAAIELLERRDETIQSLIREYLDGDPTELGLIALRAAGAEDSQVNAPFATHFERLAVARHFGLRRQAHRMLTELGIDPGVRVVTGTTKSTDLPAAYDLAYERRRSPRRILETQVRSEEFLPPSDDPVELVSPWNSEADFIARLANVQPEALYQRTVELMLELGGSDFDNAERELRQRLDRLELKLGFRRPRAALARRALGVAVAELIDAGRIADSELGSLDVILGAGDPAMLRRHPGPRPSWIAPISERAGRGHYTTGWESRVSTGQSALLQSQETTAGPIIAEETHLRWLEWDRPEEIRVGAVVAGVPPESILGVEDPLIKLCADWPHQLVSDYFTLRGDRKHLAGVQHAYRFETPGNRWLAFNPVVAKSLGWVLDTHGLFRWYDTSGVLMVETILWQDGLYEHQPPKFEDEVGWGWIVRASQKGWAAIRSHYDIRSRCVCVMRKSNKVEWQRATAMSPA
jgi:hypothetical protein